MFSKFISKTQPQSFWQWLEEHQNEVCDLLKSDPQQALETVGKQFRRDYRGLSFELTQSADDDKIQFMLSANGDRKKFQTVIDLAHNAPAFEKFDIMPFRQRKPTDAMMKAEFTLGHATIKSENVFFSANHRRRKIDLTLYMEDYDGTSAYQFGGFVLLDGFLGEYDVEQFIDGIDFQKLEKSHLFNAEPMWKLPQIVDRLKR